MQTTHKPGETLGALDLNTLVTRVVSFTILKELGLDRLTALAKEHVQVESAHKETLDKTREALKSPVKCVGKLLAAMKVVYDDGVAGGDLKQGTTFAAYYEGQTGRNLDKMGRAQQCSRVFLKLVVTEMLDESDYDNCAVDWHEKVSKIIDLVIEQQKSMACDEMLDVLRILKVRPDTGAKQLRLLKNKLEGKDTVAADGNGPELDAPNFVAILRRGLATNFKVGGHGLLLAMTEIIGAVKPVTKLPEEIGKAFYQASLLLGDAWGQHNSLVNEWDEEIAASNQPAKVITLPDHATMEKLATDFYGEMEPEHMSASVKAFLHFHEANGRLPATSAEMDAFMEAPADQAAA